MKNEEWLVVDTETNGLMPPVCAVEIAAQRMMGWEPVGEPFRILLNHDVPIEPMAEALHGYSRVYLREHGQNPVAAHQAFHDYSGRLPIVAYNISFDWNRVLQPEYVRLGVPCSGARGFCAMRLARRVIAETANYRLETLKKHFRLSGGPSHKALNDVHAVVRLFQSIFRERLEASGITGFETVAQFSCRTPIVRCLEEIKKAVREKRVWHVLRDEHGRFVKTVIEAPERRDESPIGEIQTTPNAIPPRVYPHGGKARTVVNTVYSAQPTSSATSTNVPATNLPVYVSKFGECYHVAGCRGLNYGQIPMTLSEARSWRYQPCPICGPPR